MTQLEHWTDTLTGALNTIVELEQTLRTLANQRPQPGSDASAALQALNRLRGLRRSRSAQSLADEVSSKCHLIGGHVRAKLEVAYSGLEGEIANQLERGGRDSNRPGVFVGAIPEQAIGVLSDDAGRCIRLPHLAEDDPLRQWVSPEQCPRFNGLPCLVLPNTRQVFFDKSEVLQATEEAYASQKAHQREQEEAERQQREREAERLREHAMQPDVMARRIRELEEQLQGTQ